MIMSDTGAQAPTLNANGHMKEPNGLVPGTTFPEKIQPQSDRHSLEVPSSFPGPDVYGQQTTVTLFSPSQLRQSALLLSLYQVINAAFDGGHDNKGVALLKGTRLRYDGQLFDELGTAPGTFTYIIYYTGTNDVVGTASGKRYFSRVEVVEKLDGQAAKDNTWKRFWTVPADTIAFELSTMAVDRRLQRQGLAGYLMQLAENEIKQKFKAIVKEADENEKPTRLLTLITTIKQKNGEFYSRRGFEPDYEKHYEKGWMGSERGECDLFANAVSLVTCNDYTDRSSAWDRIHCRAHVQGGRTIDILRCADTSRRLYRSSMSTHNCFIARQVYQKDDQALHNFDVPLARRRYTR